MRAVAFDLTSFLKISHFSIDSDWFDQFGLPKEAQNIRRIVINDIVYLIDRSLEDDETNLIVVNQIGEHHIFEKNVLSRHAFDRIGTYVRSRYTSSVVVPFNWHLHSEGPLQSLYAAPKYVGGGTRIHFNILPVSDRKDIFVFARTPEVVAFDRLHPSIEIYKEVRNKLADAILTPDPGTVPEATRAGIVLSQRLPQGFVQGADIQEWYDKKLTLEQREFVDKPYDGPVRLRGSAGTGKTLSLVVKFVRDGLRLEKQKKKATFGFITHSLASVDLVNAIAENLQSSGLTAGSGKHCNLEVRTLYDLAHKHLRFEFDDLTPLSLDGREGRRFQFELIESVLIDMIHSKIVATQYSDTSEEVAKSWRKAVSGSDTRFIMEIMNEFASVLDAEAIRYGEERAEQYAKGTEHRPSWLLPLPKESDRRLVLEVHRRYRAMLDDMKTISVDQMVADFDSFLNSNRWDRIRNRQGYDALFVDELHLFSTVERQILHKLIKRTVDEEGRVIRPPIFMAYDLKQSPRDSFTDYCQADNNIFTSASGLQNSDLVKLSKVFRYTPQISEFLSDLDATFPAIDIPGEWDAYAGEAQLEDGGLPELQVFRDEVSLFQSVFKEAKRLARRIGGRRVAVLCPSSEIFDKYIVSASGQFRGSIFSIESREPSSELRHAGKRFIFSMPEYVAGLQFDTVFLIHVDSEEAPTDASLGERRRFISNVYLGASRAEQSLKLSACLSRGGASEILSLALQRGTLREAAAG